MIVKKLWSTQTITQKWDKFPVNGHFYNSRSRNWKGLFLFGIIPIWIENTDTRYFDR
jgi:hypothetical protein